MAIRATKSLGMASGDGKRINFGAFLFRDHCYNLLTRLVNVSSSISRLGDASADADDTLAAAPPSVLPVERTIDLLANADVTDNPDHGDVSSEPPESARGVAIEHTLAAPVTKLSGGNHLETLLEAVLPCTVAQVFSWLWGQDTTFWEDFLLAQGETGLSVSRWSKAGQRSGVARDERGLEDLFPGEAFHGQRELTFTHPRTGFVVGPKKVVTKQAQGYRLERRPVRPEGLSPPLDRLLVFQATQMERGAPLADHFSILGRVVVTREPPDQDRQPRCRLEIGFNVAFHKSTILRGAIRSGALEETSATWKAWLATSRKVITYQRHRLGDAAANEGIASPPPAGVHKLAEAFSTGERFPDAAEAGAGGDEFVAAVEMQATTNTIQVSDPTHVMRALAGFAVRGAKTTGVPTARTLFFCLLLLMLLLLLMVVAVQQRDLGRLAFQVEKLTAAVGELRGRIDGER